MVNPSAVTRRDLLAANLDPGKMVSRVEIKEVTLGPKHMVPLHLHPCPVVGIITQGDIAYQIEGETVQHLHAGDAFYEPTYARVDHFDNEGEETAKFIAFYLLGKDENELIRIIPAK